MVGNKWTPQRTVQCGVSLRRHDTDLYRWWWLSLGLLINRHCADMHDDETVSRHLDHVWNTQRHLMPFQIEGE